MSNCITRGGRRHPRFHQWIYYCLRCGKKTSSFKRASCVKCKGPFDNHPTYNNRNDAMGYPDNGLDRENPFWIGTPDNPCTMN